MSTKEIILKLGIDVDGKQGNATLKLTDENVKELYKSFKYGKSEVNGLTVAISQGFNNAREIIQGVKESWSVLKQLLGEPIKEAAQLEVLRSNFKGMKEDLELMNQAVAGTVDEANLIKLSNQATDLGLSMQQQILLFSLAEDAGDKYGGSVEENFSKIVTASEGSAKGLKALGIQKEVYENIVNDLAKAEGKTIDNLDAETQKQIRLEAILKASGITIEDVKNKTADSADKIEQVSVAHQKMQNIIGSALSKVYQPLLKVFLDLFEWLNKTAPGIVTLVGVVGTLTAALITLRVTGISTAAASLMSQLIPAITALKTSIMTLQLSLGPIGWLTLGLTAIAGLWLSISAGQEKAAETLTKYQDRFKAFRLQEINAELNKENVDPTKAIFLKKERASLFGSMLVSPHTLTGNTSPGKGSGDPTLGLLGQIDKQINDLEKKRPFAKDVDDLIIIERKIEALKEKKEEIAATVFTALNPKVDNLAPKGYDPSKVKINKPIGDATQYAEKTKEQELQIWYDTEKAKTDSYANSLQLRMALDEEYTRRKEQLEEESAMATMDIASNTFGVLAGFMAKHTAAYKVFAIAQAVIDTWKAANLALASGPPPWNFIQMGAVILAGLGNVAKIAATNVEMKGYAKGGVVVGEEGPEVIAPMQDYARGWAQVVSQTKFAVENNLKTTNSNTSFKEEFNSIKNELKNWNRNLKVIISRNELIDTYDKGKTLQLGVAY